MEEFRKKMRTIVIGTETPAGKLFDIFLIMSIFVNSCLIIFESVELYQKKYIQFFSISNVVFLVLFGCEYLLRLWVVENRKRYAFSLLGIIDFWAIIPNLLTFVIPTLRLFSVIRVFRLLRLFSIFKLGRYMEESTYLIRALKASKPKIIVFISTIMAIIVLVGAFMYIVEGPKNGFDNIPESMYWAVVTISTVGYGDISPQTTIGKMIASLLMIVAYGIIAVPTGIITYEIAQVKATSKVKKRCLHCHVTFMEFDDLYCSKCGEKL